MANLKEVRTRIESVKSTRQITSAMKLVAASKLRKAQNAIMALRPYANKLQEMMGNLGDSINTEENPYLRKDDPEKVLIIPFTSNKGLCGAFNSNIIKWTAKYIDEKYSKQKSEGKLFLVTIGKKATEHFSKRDYEVVASHDYIYDELSFENAAKIAKQVMEAFKEKEYDRVELVYNKFINAASQKVMTEQFLPLEPPASADEEKREQETDYIFEPDKETITEELIPKTLKIQFYKAILDSNASEHGARMTAMHQATENATQLVKELQLSYNKARQEAITNEILEVTTGAEALKG